MRHAVVVAPPGFSMPTQGSVFAAPEPVGPVCAALARGGHRLVVTQTTVDLETDFERALAGIGPSDDLLVVLAAMTTTRADSVNLVLSDDRSTLGLRVLSDAILVREPASALFVVEACHDGDPDDPMLAAEHVDAIARALDVRARGYGALVGVRAAAGAVPGAWPFTRHLLYTVAEPESHDDRGAAPMSLVYERMRNARPDDARVQSFAFVRGRTDFVLVEPPDVVHVAASMRTGPASVPPSGARSAPASHPISSRPPRSAQPSLPPMEPLVDLADGARARGAWEEALAAYKAALMVAPQPGTDDGVRASIYARIGDVKRAQGKPREAELNYEKALSADARHRAALDALVDLATEAKDVRRAIDWRRKRLKAIDGSDARVAELLAIARAQQGELGDARAAAETLEEARRVDPRDLTVAEALREAYEKLHRWPRVVDVLAEIAELTTDPAQRAAVRFAAADVALGRLREEERGLGLLDRALDDDPTHDKALHALVAVRTTRNEWDALDAAYTRLIDRFAKLGDAERAWDVCRKLGALRRDKTRDVVGAIEAFTGAVSCKPSDIDSRAMLADMHLARGDEAQAVAEFERVAQDAPLRASTYARLFALHQRAGRADRGWLAATALEELGAADVDQQLMADQFRPEGPVRPSRSLDDAGWDEVLRAPGSDDVVAEVLRAIVDAATAARIEELREARKLIALDPARLQSATSTVTAVRSFQWAAQVLGVDAPELYVLDEVPGGIAAVPAPHPSTALGPDVLRGLGAKDLAFLAGRHLTYYRREHYALVCYPTLPELSALFLGAVKLVMPELPVPGYLSDAVARRRKTLVKHADDAQKKSLRAAVERLDARGGRVDLAAWIKSVELSGQRAGLLLCGDLKVAMTRMRAEKRAIAELGLDQRRADLLSFCASDKLGRARGLLGVDANAPPASQRQVG
ncbi:MAG TPA: tetratricopeptide repeat protein [Polyangiaceae bacterium]